MDNIYHPDMWYFQVAMLSCKTKSEDILNNVIYVISNMYFV